MDKKHNIIQEAIQAKKIRSDKTYRFFLIGLSSLVIFVIIALLATIILQGFTSFFKFDDLNLGYFLFGGYYNPTGAAFAAGFMIINTIWISFLALLIATPISVFTALFITRVLPKSFRNAFFVIISILAAIPTVIYGAFGLFLIDNIVRSLFGVPPGTALSVIITLAFMIMPTITILTITSIDGVDRKMENSSLALGATKMQTSLSVTLSAAKKGIFVAILLGLGRALGEATAVSMVASQSSYGPTFNPLGFVTLITATMLQGFVEVAPGSIEQANFFAMAGLLMITILIIFLALKIIENRLDIESKTKRIQDKISTKNKIYEKVETESLASLNKKEYKLYVRHERKRIIKQQTDNSKAAIKSASLGYELAKINDRNSYVQNEFVAKDKHKKHVSWAGTVVVVIFSMIGIALLISIIGFLFGGGFSVLEWDFISTKGFYKEVDGQNIYGLATPIFGTIITVIFTLLFAFPLGVSIGVVISVYLKRNSHFSRILGLFIQILTGIPALIYGIIGSIIFIPLFSNDVIEFNALSSAITLGLFVLPTIVKTTQEGFERIPSSQKNAALALGSTNLIATRKVLLKQVFPSIVSAAVLAAGLVIADSAIFITMYGTLSRSSGIEWIKSGGTTLASEIYKLTKQEVILWDYVKAIGIIILALILTITSLSILIRETKYMRALAVFAGLILVISGILVAFLWLFIIGLIVILFTIIVWPLIIFVANRFGLQQRINQWIFEKREGI